MLNPLEDDSRWTVRGNCGARWRNYICKHESGHAGLHSAVTPAGGTSWTTGLWSEDGAAALGLSGEAEKEEQ